MKCVRAYTQTSAAKGDQGGDCHDVADNHWIDGGMSPIACPMAVTMTSYFLCILLQMSWDMSSPEYCRYISSAVYEFILSDTCLPPPPHSVIPSYDPPPPPTHTHTLQVSPKHHYCFGRLSDNVLGVQHQVTYSDNVQHVFSFQIASV